MKNWIRFPRIEGQAPRQAHCDLPEGTYERELGREGFFGPATHMLHKHPPTSWTAWEGPLRPRALDLNELDSAGPCPWQAPEIMHNGDMRMRQWQPDGDMDHLVRNSDGDELLFIHEGTGELYCDYGRMTFRDGDYIVIPRGTQWRIAADGTVRLLLIEATDSAYQLPEKGMVGHHAIFDPALLTTPAIDDAFRAQQTEEPWQVIVKRQGRLSTVTYPYNPLDALGWQGDLAPVKINWRDIRPLMSHRYHLPPSAHTTFVARGFVVCTFVPRPIESDPGALKVPFFHNNDDYDEIIFYHRGEFFSRDNIHPGMLSLHPCGFPHGPHPKALKTGARHARKETDEVAVMIDTRHAVTVNELPGGVENRAYVDSWRGV